MALDIHNRTEQLVGAGGVAALARASVTVFGLGGVGSYAAEALARAGVGSLRLVDFDVVHATNINRQLFALHSTVGRPKVEVALQRVLDINPSCTVRADPVFVDEAALEYLLDPAPDAVIDAIDGLASKVRLIRTAARRGHFIVSSMGAAGRFDCGAVTVGDLSETRNCPLARMLRKKLHKDGIYSGIRCVYSIEPADTGEPVDSDEMETASGKGRPRTPLGSISYLPALFGIRAAGEVIGHLLDIGKSGPAGR